MMTDNAQKIGRPYFDPEQNAFIGLEKRDMTLTELVKIYENCEKRYCTECALSNVRWEKVPVCTLLEEAEEAMIAF